MKELNTGQQNGAIKRAAFETQWLASLAGAIRRKTGQSNY